MRKVDNQYKCLPFWSWNDALNPQELVAQVDWMERSGIGGFFMHARGGLTTEYLGVDWFKCIEAAGKEAQKLGMKAYAYDENGWPSGFAGGKLLDDPENHDRYLTFAYGAYDPKSLASYDVSGASLVRVTEGAHVLNVYQHYSGSTADICQKEVVRKFLDLTHEQYKKRDTYGLQGFFTDEPQYYRWGTSFTKALFPYFQEHYGEDVLNRLGLLFVEKEGYRDFRYKYWKAMQDLMLHSFGEQIYTWCDQNHYKLTGHYVEETSLYFQMECCGGIMPYYEFEHIPGVDWLGRDIYNDVSPRQVASVAAQLGKKQVLSEMFACSGWDVSPKELKHIAEYLYVGGVNLMCQHLLPYHEEGQRKRDYPAHYSTVNPWVEKSFKDFNDYFSVLGESLSKSKEVVDVAIFHPIRSAYFNYKRDEEATGCGVKELDVAFAALVEEMRARKIPFHFIDETLLAKCGSVQGNTLVLGACSYHYLILPKMYTMDKSSEVLLREYVKNGGKVHLYSDKPTYLEGQPFEYSYLQDNVSMDEIVSSLPFVMKENPNIALTYRLGDDGKFFYFLVNLAGAIDVNFHAKGYRSFTSYDILTDSTKKVGEHLHFEEGQSYLLYPSLSKAPLEADEKPLLHLPKKAVLAHPVDNFLTLDFLSYSFDNMHYSPFLHHMGVFDELLKKRYAGPLYQKYVFEARVLPKKCLLLAEEVKDEKILVNGHAVVSMGPTAVESKLLRYDIAPYLHQGQNEILLEFPYSQGENVYYALFGENVTESLKNCLAYDHTIEPVYLLGDFGVYGDFSKGNKDNILLGEHFYLAEQKREIRSLIEDGFPFFRGDIDLIEHLDSPTKEGVLEVLDRFQLLEVKLNGVNLGKMMFSSYLDLSKALQVGGNEVRLTLTISNRNLLGPFHTLAQEDLGVGPYSFERTGTWKDGVSSILRPSYSFVKSIL